MAAESFVNRRGVAVRILYDEIMTNKKTLTPADEMAQKSGPHFPNESAEYRQARKALLAVRRKGGQTSLSTQDH